MDTLTGLIERVVFHNADTGFTVLRVQADRRRDLATVIGHLPTAVAGEYVEASGAWIQDRDHGLQFKADQLRTTPPSGPAPSLPGYALRSSAAYFFLRPIASRWNCREDCDSGYPRPLKRRAVQPRAPLRQFRGAGIAP